MIKNTLVTNLLEKCYTKDMKEQDDIVDDNEEMEPEEDELEEKCKTYKECQEQVQEAFFGVNYK